MSMTKWQKVLQMGRKQSGKWRNCSLRVFKRLILQTRKNQGLFGKGLNLSSVNSFSLEESKHFVRERVKRDKRKFLLSSKETNEEYPRNGKWNISQSVT